MLKKNVKEYSFLDRAIGQWNMILEEVVCLKIFVVFKKSGVTKEH